MNRPQRDGYGTVVVGAGIVGLFTAWHLARMGAGSILVVDRGFLSRGASGRNGGGIRQQWETPATIRLARESVSLYRRFNADFGYNIWFRQSGYLFVAETAEELARLSAVRDIVAREGLPARLLEGPEGVARQAPALDTHGLKGGTFLGTDGTLYPFPAIWGVYEAARSLGVEVALGVDATAIRRDGERVRGVQTSAGEVRCRSVVNAAGGWSSEVALMADAPLPNVPTRHEILATEPLKPFLDPMVVRISDGLYFSQTMRGEIVGGLSLGHPPGTSAGMPSSIDFLRAMARALCGLLPAVRHLNVLRAWSGFYDDTPDGLPILGEDPRRPGLFHANGFGGHGFMLAPSASRRVALSVVGEPTDLPSEQFGAARFLSGAAQRPTERLQLG